MALATATPDGRPSVRMVLLKSADERGFTFFRTTGRARVASSRRTRRRRCSSTGPGSRCGWKAPSTRVPAQESDAYWATRPPASRRSAAASQQSRPDRVAGGARSCRRARSPRSRHGPRLGRLSPDPRRLRVLAPPRRPPARASLVSGDAAANGRCYFSNREGCSPQPEPRWHSPPSPSPEAHPPADARRLPGLPRVERRGTSRSTSCPSPRTRLHADRLDRARLAACTPTSARASTTARASASPTSWCTGRRRRSRASRSNTPTRATRARTRSRRTSRSRARPHVTDGDRHALIVDRDSCKLYELYALHRQGEALGGGLGRDLEPALERAPPGRLDVGRRGGPADPAGTRALGRRRVDRCDRPRAALHRRADAQRVHLPGAPRGDRRDSDSVTAADGAPRAAEGERRHQQAAAAGAHRRAGDEDATG